METKKKTTTAEVAIKIQEAQEKFDQQKVHLASIFDEQVAKIESEYRKQRVELQETYLKNRREVLHRKHEAQTALESARQKEFLKIRLEANLQAATSGESDGTKAER